VWTSVLRGRSRSAPEAVSGSPDALGAEDLVEGVAELRVVVVDEEPEGVLIAEFYDEVEAMYSIRRVASEMKNT
jgi:hypothetical protein